MAKKTLSFAEKAAKKKNKSDIKYVKYVGSVRSEKTGQWRFNERMIGLVGGESLDAALKRIDEEKKLLNIELPDPDQVESAAIEEAGESVEVAEGVPTKESSEIAETEEAVIDEGEEIIEEVAEEEPNKESSEIEKNEEAEDIDSSKTEEDSAEDVDEEIVETDSGEDSTPKSEDPLKEDPSEKKEEE